MARNPAFRQGQGRVARDTTLPPSFTPVMETSQPDGSNFQGAQGGSGLADPSLIGGISAGLSIISGAAVGIPSSYSAFAINQNWDRTAAPATITVELVTPNAGTVIDVNLTPNDGDGQKIAEGTITFGTATTDPITIRTTVTNTTGEDGPFVFEEEMAVVIANPGTAPAVADNTSLNFQAVGGASPSAQTLTDIQNSFNAAVTRLNAQFELDASTHFDLLNSPVGPNKDETFLGMAVPVVELFSDPTDPVLAFMVQSTANVRFADVAFTCVGMGVNIASLQTEGGNASTNALTAIMTHELIHGLGTPGVYFLTTSSSRLSNDGALEEPSFPLANAFWRDNAGDNAPGVPCATIGGQFADHWSPIATVRGSGTTYNGVTNDIMIPSIDLDTLASNNITDITRLALQDQGYSLVTGSSADAAPTFVTLFSVDPVVENFKSYIVDPDVQRAGGSLYEKYHKFS